jgi:nickel-dependent lactate racemase
VKSTVSDIRKIVNDVLIEQTISATPEYLKKEKIRQELQDVIVSRVASGDIKNEKELAGVVNDMHIAMTALKMIPLVAWKRLAKSE